MGFINEIEELGFTRVIFQQPMKKHTSFGVGGVSKFYAEADSLCTLNQLITTAKKHKVKFKLIGNGTNVLFSDKGYNGLIICTKKLNDVFFKRNQVKAMAGADLTKLIKFTVEHGLSGCEKLSGIPATVGGAVVMNAGAFGQTISDAIVEVETLEKGKIKKYFKNQCLFSYRSSRFKINNQAIVSATFEFATSDKEKLINEMALCLERRKRIHPTGRSCGSVFKNPTPNSAGALIERAGLKGVTIGGATVSEKHGNFIITSSSATATDVKNLIEYIKDKVFNAFGIMLEEEVEYVGEF